MKIRLLSDLHLEGGVHKELFASKGEDVLVLAGDIHVGAYNVTWMLEEFAKNAKQVVYVSGNHEYYKNHMETVNYQIQNWCKGTNVHFLNPGSVTLSRSMLEDTEDSEHEYNGQYSCNGLGSDKVTFIGGTLWSNFADDHISKMTVPRMINDFRLITHGTECTLFTAAKCSDLYEEHASFIKEAYAKVEGKKVIVSHFLPDRVCIDKQYQGPDLINNYFANNLGEWVADLKDVPYWLFGHTHENVDLMIGDTNMIANPYGYGKNREYKEKLIEV